MAIIWGVIHVQFMHPLRGMVPLVGFTVIACFKGVKHHIHCEYEKLRKSGPLRGVVYLGGFTVLACLKGIKLGKSR